MNICHDFLSRIFIAVRHETHCFSYEYISRKV
nr:MAG TPA: hypothetical protein [Caudoviricetes sp.]